MTERRDPAIRVVAMPADANAYGDIFGGWLLSLMDNGAGLTAARRAKGRAVTVAIRPQGVLLELGAEAAGTPGRIANRNACVSTPSTPASSSAASRLAKSVIVQSRAIGANRRLSARRASTSELRTWLIEISWAILEAPALPGMGGES